MKLRVILGFILGTLGNATLTGVLDWVNASWTPDHSMWEIITHPGVWAAELDYPTGSWATLLPVYFAVYLIALVGVHVSCAVCRGLRAVYHKHAR